MEFFVFFWRVVSPPASPATVSHLKPLARRVGLVQAAGLGGDFVNLTGDIMLSSGYIAYLGAFTIKYRDEACGNWKQLCQTSQIPASDTFSLVKVPDRPHS